MEDATIRNLMEEAISESEKSVAEDGRVHPKVGSILTNQEGKILLRSHREKDGSHSEYNILKKAEEQGLDLSNTTLFVTLEPCTSRGTGKIPCAQRIADSKIETVYIGMLDPNPMICGKGETFLRAKNKTVERFHNEFIKQIEKSNKIFFDYYRQQLLPDNSLYVKKQISELMVEYLNKQGLKIKEIPSEWGIDIDDIFQYLCNIKSDYNLENMELFIRDARRYAYDKKYKDYTYTEDIRGINQNWKNEILDIFKTLNISNIENFKILNVGCGNGIEGKNIFSNVKKLTLVDIGKESLDNASKLLPSASFELLEAENLSTIPSFSQDIYISLRTFQSSYFNINEALREALRVTRAGGAIIISIANGFIGNNNNLITGLVIPGTNLINKNRPYDLVEEIRQKLTLLKCQDIGIRTGIGEIFVYARKMV
jgi:pyrimidine deaminase RibD-like protein/SAM-dependent methyltransferase